MGSPDEMPEVLAAGDPRLSLVRPARNLGTAAAKNVGLMLAGDRAVTFHDFRRPAAPREPEIMAAASLN